MQTDWLFFGYFFNLGALAESTGKIGTLKKIFLQPRIIEGGIADFILCGLQGYIKKVGKSS